MSDEPLTELQQMSYDAELEVEDERLAGGALPPVPRTSGAIEEASARRAAEDAAAAEASRRWYTETPEGRAAAARVIARMDESLAAYEKEKAS